jgi:hypothetical protein
MNKQEAKILHGLYHHRRMIGEKILYSTEALFWLTRVSFDEGQNWVRPDNTLNMDEAPGDDYLGRHAATAGIVVRALSYLESMGFIEYLGSANGEVMITVTGAGANRARDLASWYGRLNLLYKEHKDGVVWFLATILVSLVTAWITAHLTNPGQPMPGK